MQKSGYFQILKYTAIIIVLLKVHKQKSSNYTVNIMYIMNCFRICGK